jgi:hypothetical protein
MNADLSKKWLKFCPESALICVHRRFKGSKSKLAKVQLRKKPLAANDPNGQRKGGDWDFLVAAF